MNIIDIAVNAGLIVVDEKTGYTYWAESDVQGILTKFAELIRASEPCKHGNKAKFCEEHPMECVCVYDATQAQASEPVAKVLFRQDEDGLMPIAFYSNDEYPEKEKLKDRFVLLNVYLSPPNTQQKLDKAREALESISGSCELTHQSWTKKKLLELIKTTAQATLKEIE
jgi:hypothetical protein